ncbi:MAG: hypothetical protein FWE08_06175 [Oscillospiraceae bacterium]|nr:hypothetical protein [Oscillospiraceae bacterium]
MAKTFFHGNRVIRLPGADDQPAIEVTSGLTFVVGTAPVHTVGGAVNEVLRLSAFPEAQAALGFRDYRDEDGWGGYTLCEVMDNHFREYRVGPVLFVNVLDPARHRRTVAQTDYPVTDRQVRLPFEAIADTIAVQGGQLGVDFGVFYDSDACVLEVITGGILAGASSVQVAYDAVDPGMVTKLDIIGGQDVATGARSGFELISSCIPRHRTLPGTIICPKWSLDPDVAAVMDAKTVISGILFASALVDLPAEAGTHYARVPGLKADAGSFTSGDMTPCWPKLRRRGKVYHYSTHMAAVMARTDAESDGIPSVSPSNKRLIADAAVLDDGTEVLLELPEANYLNANGIVTALNLTGWAVWGNYTGAYPDRKHPQYAFLSVNRMLKFLANRIVLGYWARVDERMTMRFLDSLADEANIELNGLVRNDHLISGRVETLREDNPSEDLMAGIVRPRIKATPPSPVQEITWLLEYDMAAVMALFG